MPSPLFESKNNTLLLKGDWLLTEETPEVPELNATTTLDLKNLGKWDSSLIAWIWHIKKSADTSKEPKYVIKFSSAPENILKLVDIAEAASGQTMSAIHPHHLHLANVLGESTTLPAALMRSKRYKAAVWLGHAREAVLDAISFLGDIFINLAKFASKATREHFRPMDWLEELFQAGYRAVPIVAFLSFLVGLILAFVSAIQLKMFGASIYVADLVGISMTREMGALMTAIIMAGRTGAAYAAQIGAMKRSEELDALRTMGLSPVTMVVLPKVIALTAMVPLLSVLSTFIGMFAGLVVANSVLDISIFQYINETASSVPIHDLFIGVAKAVVYGFLVAFAGAWRGMRCGNSADAVGKAATSAVVLSLTLIVIADGFFAIILNAMNK